MGIAPMLFRWAFFQYYKEANWDIYSSMHFDGTAGLFPGWPQLSPDGLYLGPLPRHCGHGTHKQLIGTSRDGTFLVPHAGRGHRGQHSEDGEESSYSDLFKFAYLAYYTSYFVR